MSDSVQRRIASIFMQAEHDRMCAVAPSPRDERALRYRARRAHGVLALGNGLFVRDGYWQTLNEAERHRRIVRTLAAKHPGWTFCLYSAAVLFGLSVSNRLLGTPHILGSRTSGRGRASALAVPIVHNAGPREAVLADGVRATPLLQTLLDCCLDASFADGLAIADSALRLYGIGREVFVEFVAEHGRRRHGVSKAQAVARFADGRAESGGESIARATMIEAGFALPELQVKLVDPVDAASFRVDFLWRTPGSGCIIGEFDGRQKYRFGQDDARSSDIDVVVWNFARERKREARLSACGPIVRFGYADVMAPGRLASLLDAYGVPRRTLRESIG